MLDTSLSRQLDALLSEEIADVQERERSAFDRILTETSGRLVLFGAGSLGQSSLQCLLRDGIRPLAICDNNFALWGSEIDGIPILSPADAAAAYGADAAFFVTIWGLNHRYAETQDRLTAAGCRQVHPASALRWKYPAEMLPFFLQDLPHKVYEEADRVRAAFQLWADDRSREEYLAQIRYRALGDCYCLSAPDREASYFLDSLYSLDPDEVFIDCGAFDGDTLQEVLGRRNGAFAQFVALEPDPQSFAALQRFIGSLPPVDRLRISAHPYAVSSKRGQARFSASGDLSSAISASAGLVIDTAPLDEVLQDLAPTFIKMDIEGAEVEALEGARQVIAKHNPLLAICLYHRQSDLWRIPLLIHSIHPGYRFFLRSHETDGWQTVGYAIPPERLKPSCREEVAYA